MGRRDISLFPGHPCLICGKEYHGDWAYKLNKILGKKRGEEQLHVCRGCIDKGPKSIEFFRRSDFLSLKHIAENPLLLFCL